MGALGWIILTSVAMSLVALVGALALLLKESTLHRIILPLVALSAGSLLGGAFLIMIPAALNGYDNDQTVFLWVLAGFITFLLLEQLLHWHHCHQSYGECKQPLTYLILIGDGLHNFIGGLAVAGIFLMDIHLGLVAWAAAVAHEVPQELGDFGVLIHGGWSKKKALLFNMLSALTYMLGGIMAYLFSFKFNLEFLVPFAAGNFIYIGASDLVPKVNKHLAIKENLINTMVFILGVWLILGSRLIIGS